MKDEKLVVKVGNTYETKDGRKVIVFRHNSVNNEFEAVVLNTTDFMCVHDDGKYFETHESHNDLVKLVK